MKVGVALSQQWPGDVRFTLKADMCGAMSNVCFGPIADIGWLIQSPRRPPPAAIAAQQDLMHEPIERL
jgi:hypothetical protein